MAETHTTPSNLNKNENVPINSRIMVTSPAGETTTAAALAFLDVITTCTSAADAENKVVQIPDYTESVLPNNLKLHVTFTNGNTYGDTTSPVVYYPKLAIYNANSQLIGTLDICDSRGHFAGSGFCNPGDQMDFVRVGDKAKITNSDVRQVTQAYTILSDGQSVYNANQVNGALADGYKEVYDSSRKVGMLKYSWEDSYNKTIKEVDVFFENITLTTDFRLVVGNILQYIENGIIMDMSVICENSTVVCFGDFYVTKSDKHLYVKQNVSSSNVFTVKVHIKYYI